MIGSFYAYTVRDQYINQVSTQVIINRDTVTIKGCNTLTAPIDFSSKTRFHIGAFTSTLRFCDLDQDGIVSDGLASSVRAVWQDELLVFYDANGS